MKKLAYMISLVALIACTDPNNAIEPIESEITPEQVESLSSRSEELPSPVSVSCSSVSVDESSSSISLPITIVSVQNCVSMIITDGLDSIASSEDYSGVKGGGGGAGCGIAAFVKGTGVSRANSPWDDDTYRMQYNYTDLYDSSLAHNPPPHMIRLDSILEGRIQKLSETGIASEQAECIAQMELFKALGFDSVISKKSGATKLTIDRALDYIFGGTTQSDFYKDVNDYFANTGTLLPKHYCNFNDLEQFRSVRNNGKYYPNIFNTYPSYTLYDNSTFESKGCASGLPRPIPLGLVNETRRMCMNLPQCEQSIRDTIIRTKSVVGFMASTIPYVCRENGWNTPTDMELETFGTPCDKEGRYIVYSKNSQISFVCSLDSGWYEAQTTDAETFDVPCDKNGKLYKSPNRPKITYVCRTTPFCRSIDTRVRGLCFTDKGWDIAQAIDFETGDDECDSEGKTHQSPLDSNMYYVCHDGIWTKFFDMPCDTDNKRVKVVNEIQYNAKIFEVFVCYDKTWRSTMEWHTDYPTEYYFNPDFDYGSFEDPRDHRIYRTTVFKGKTWMAENMKYEGTFLTDIPQSTTCLQDSCKNLGRFYDLYAAATVCPEGWRLPDSSDIKGLGNSPEEIEDLFSQLSEKRSTDSYGMSFVTTGKIVNTDQNYSNLQGFTLMIWMNPTQEKKRLAANILPGGIGREWVQDLREMYAGQEYDNTTYLAVRCIKE